MDNDHNNKVLFHLDCDSDEDKKKKKAKSNKNILEGEQF